MRTHLRRSPGFWHVLASILAAACSLATPAGPFPDFNSVERILVIADGGRDTIVITDPHRIAEIVSFANARNSNWELPWYGVPVPSVTAAFYGAGYQGHFGAGSNFFETMRNGRFASRSADPNDVLEFARLLEVDDFTIAGIPK